MRVLWDDILQRSDAPPSLISPALADIWQGSSVTITLDKAYTIDALGIGYTDATIISIDSIVVIPSGEQNKDGLYRLPRPITGRGVTISHNGSYIGRLALGQGPFIGCAPAREPGFKTTHQSRQTLSGQVIPGTGGITQRRMDVDVRYGFTREIFEQIQSAYPDQLARGFPLFVLFDKETHRMPWERIYATTDPDLLFQSSANFFKYSRKLSFLEAF